MVWIHAYSTRIQPERRVDGSDARWFLTLDDGFCSGEYARQLNSLVGTCDISSDGCSILRVLKITMLF